MPTCLLAPESRHEQISLAADNTIWQIRITDCMGPRIPNRPGMNPLLPNPVRTTRRPSPGAQGSAQTILLVVAFFFLGIAVSVFVFYFTGARGPAGAGGETRGTPAIQLSDSTRAVLSRLRTPLEIRFYDVLDPATVPAPMVAFAGRVRQLLSAYQQEAGGKIKLTSFDSASQINPNAAAVAGIQVFNLDKGEACYLGLTLTLNGRKETMSYLSPDWEKALEPDLTRAIARLLEPTQTVVSGPAPLPAIDTNAIQEVKTMIPNLNAVSLEEGKRILREAALKDFAAAVKEAETQVQEAEQRLGQAQASGTETDKQAAMQHLRQVRTEQAEKLRQIAAKSNAQVDALEQIKAAPH